VFSLNGALDLHGGRQLPAIEDPSNGLKSLVIDFDNFFSELPREVGDAPALIGRAIDTQISQSLFQLPIPGAEGGGDNVLAAICCAPSSTTCLPVRWRQAMGVGPLIDPATGERFSAVRRRHAVVVLHPARAEVTSGGGELVRSAAGRSGGVRRPARQDNQKTIYQTESICGCVRWDFRIGDLLVADQLGRRTSATG
jgi:hypothetical protein